MSKSYWATVLVFVGAVSYAQAEPGVIAEGNTVRMEYTLTVNGEVVDSSIGREPLEYVHGSQMLIPGLEKELTGLKAGDVKVVVVAPQDAYGEKDPRAVIEVPRENLDPDIVPQKGVPIELRNESGQPLPGMIEDVREQTVVINFNHPLAGKTLTFEVKILDVK